MPTIRPSADLRNNYNEISQFCHKYAEPVFITKNGKGDLAVLSIKAYEKALRQIWIVQPIKWRLAGRESRQHKTFWWCHKWFEKGIKCLMYKIVVTDTAQKDLQNAVSYISNEFRGNKFETYLFFFQNT